jgi:hypothetical protein
MQEAPTLKEMFATVQQQYLEGVISTNKIDVQYNHDIIVNNTDYDSFFEIVKDIAEALEIDCSSILTAMYASATFEEILSIFDYHFGDRITLRPIST